MPIAQCPDRKLDIVWVVDNSGSIDDNGSNGPTVLKELMYRLTDAYTLSQTQTRFAGLRFANTIINTKTTPTVNYPLGKPAFGTTKPGRPFNFIMDQSTNVDAAWDDFAATMKADSNTNTPVALQGANYILGLSEEDGGPRTADEDTIRILILFTDGNPNRYKNAYCGDKGTYTGSESGQATKPIHLACTEYWVKEIINNHDVYVIFVKIGANIDADFLQYCIELPSKNGAQPLPIQTVEATFEDIQETVDSVIEASCIDESFMTPQTVGFKYDGSVKQCANNI